MNALKWILIGGFAASSLISCSTGYHPVGFGGGYSTTQLDENVFQVSFRGNGYTRHEKASDFALLRSAEIALEHGYPFFAIVDGQRYSEQTAVTTPSSSTTNLNATTYGTLNSGSYTANTYGTATTYGGQTFLIRRPTASNTIVCFKEKPQGFAYNAKVVISSIKETYGLQ